jgi:hypothetical protein
MAAALGDRGAEYMGLAVLCDGAAGADYSGEMVRIIAREQDRLGVLRGLVNRAYRGEPSDELRAHMHGQMTQHRVTASQFCDAALSQAQADLSRRVDVVLALDAPPPLTLASARDRGWLD